MTEPATLYDKFIYDVSTGRLLSCEYVKLSVQRHIKDLKKSHSDDYPFYFSRDRADHAIKFIKKCRHTDGEYYGKRFNLQPFQAFIVAMLFGWLKKSNDKRRFQKAYIEMPRKNGKSELAAAIAFYMLVKDGERGAEVYTFANSKEQAKVVFNIVAEMARQMISESPRAKELINLNYYNINVPAFNSKLEALAADSKLLDGRR